MVRSQTVRKSGKTTATETVEKESEDFEKPAEAVLPEDTERWFGTFGLSRLRSDWTDQDQITLARIKQAIENRMLTEFYDAYAIMSDLYDIVRQPELDDNGQPKKDRFGLVIWSKSPTGTYFEDWSRLSSRQKEDFLYRITTAQFEWEQRAADLWTEAMFAKALWQEHFAQAFDAPMSGTIDDRTQQGNLKAAEDRYFALYVSGMSRKAEAIVRSMSVLAQRLKDTLD